MIGRLRGVLSYKQPPFLMIDVQGVGYELEASLSTFARLPEVGSEVSLYTHLAVREDAHTLFGFAGLNERALFRNLIRISGIGAKSALLILSGMDVASFSRCVQEGDTVALTRLPGIGKKTAERIVIEMRDRIGAIAVGPGRVQTFAAAADGERSDIDSLGAETEPAAATADAVSALVALGYKLADATRRVQAANRAAGGDGDKPALSSEELIRQALRATVRG